MICPYCEEEMQIGWVDQDRYGLRWTPSDERGFLERIFESHDIGLTSIEHGGRLIVYHCETCRKFIIDENDIEV